MAPPLAEPIAQAQALTSAGELVRARAVLDRALVPAGSADPATATPDLAVAAALHARILTALGDPHAARAWAGFALAAETRLHGSADERTIAAANTYAAVLARVGHHTRAAQIYHSLVGTLTELEGRDSDRVLMAEADLATAEHAAGQCTAARGRLAEAWARHRRLHGDAAPAGIKMLARLAVMERECGLADESRRHLDRARDLCARHLPPDHPLARQIGRLAEGRHSGNHRCGQVKRSAGPQDPPPQLPRQMPDEPADNRPTDPNGNVYQSPLYLSQVNQESRTERPGRHERADTPLPTPGQRPVFTPDGRRVPIGTVPIDGSERRLPVRVDRPEPAPSKQPFVLAAVLVAGIGAAAAVVAATLPRSGGAPATTAPPSAVTTAPAAATSGGAGLAPGAPTGVKLRDNRDSVALTWAYPKGAEGPVMISGGRTGQVPQAFQQLAPGTSDYIVYGLNEQADYCFTVAVVYSTERVAGTSPVCTSRG